MPSRLVAPSKIGAGSVVVSSVPPNATVVGVPGHVIAFLNEDNDTVERLPDPEWDRIEELERRVQALERATAEGSFVEEGPEPPAPARFPRSAPADDEPTRGDEERRTS